jgi:hypothetical protein
MKKFVPTIALFAFVLGGLGSAWAGGRLSAFAEINGCPKHPKLSERRDS